MVRKILVLWAGVLALALTESGWAASIVVAASDSSAQGKARADYICDGTNDQVELLASINAAGVYSVDVADEPNHTMTVSCKGRHSVEWLAGSYNLGATLVIPEASDLSIQAEGTYFTGPASGSAVIVRGANRCVYRFGNISCRSGEATAAALKIQPLATMPVVFSKIEYTGLSGLNHQSIGLQLDPSLGNICYSRFKGTNIMNVHTGIQVNSAGQHCEGNWFWVSFVAECLQCVYEQGGNVQKNFWEVNVDAWLDNAEAIRTGGSHGKWYVIMGTGGHEGINNALVLDPGASHNVIEMHPPIENYVWQNNSGNTTNVILTTRRPPYVTP